MRFPFCCIALTLLAVSSWANPSWQATRTDQPPAIDGNLHDPCWESQTLVNNFADVLSGETAAQQTYFRVVFDDEALYLAVQCKSPDAPRANLSTHDDTLWADDSVEVLLDPSNRRQSYARLVVNSRSALYDAWMTNGGTTADPDYESGAQVCAGQTDDGWTCELRIPYAGLRLGPEVKDTWGINICRTRWSDPVERSCWSSPKADTFQRPDAFGTFTGLKVNFRSQMIAVDTPRFTDPAYEDGKLVGALRIPYVNWTGRAAVVNIQARFRDLQGTVTQSAMRATIPAGRGILPVPVTIGKPGFADLDLEIRRADTDRLVTSGRFPMSLRYEPVDIFFEKPAYRDTLYASLPCPEVVCKMKVNLPQKLLGGARLRATFSAGTTELSVRTVDKLLPRGEATVAFSSEIVPAGEYWITAKAIGRDGEVLAESKKLLRKLKPQAGEVLPDEQGRIHSGGSLMLPFGFLNSTPVTELARTGFNVVVAPPDLGVQATEKVTAYLDSAQSLGMKVLLWPYTEAPGPLGFRGRAQIVPEDMAVITTLVERFKTHPALLGWVLCDSPRNAVWRASLEVIYRAVAEIDPYHPCVALDDTPASLLKLQDCADILCWAFRPGFDVSGGAREPLTTLARGLADIRAAIPASRPLWVSPQAFSLADREPSRAKIDRAPNLTESRAMTYLALMSGATGLLPDSWTEAAPRPSVRNTYLECLGPEVNLIAPAVLEGETVKPAGVTALKAGSQVLAQYWLHDDSFFIVAVNGKPADARARLFARSLANRRLRVLAENRFIQTVGASFDDAFGPLAVHVYSDKRKLPSLLGLDQVEQHIHNDEAAQRATW
jgi:hypothetical protein